MYRIELSPGEETAFRSIEELAVAIRRKVVTSRARIYHNATSRWLPIQFHPHYKIALSMPLTQADLVAGPPVAPLSTLKLGEQLQPSGPPASLNREAATKAALAAWPEPKPASSVTSPVTRSAQLGASPVPAPTKPRPPQPAVEPRRMRLEPIAPALPEALRSRRAEPVTWSEPVRDHSPRRRRKLKRSLRVALAGAVLIACAHLAVSGATGPSSEVAGRPRTPRQLIQVPAEVLKDVTPRTVAAVMPVLQTIPVPGGKPSSAPISLPTRGSQSAPDSRALPATTSTAADSTAPSAPAPEIEVAPDAGNLNVSIPAKAEPAPSPVVDSTGKKALKGILRTISGSPASLPTAPKR
jgi:hypothetical protein